MILPYADYVNGGSIGRSMAIGIDYYQLDTEDTPYALGYNVKFGLSDNSYLGVGAISFESLYDIEYFFTDFEFSLIRKKQFLLSGYVSVFSDKKFETMVYMPGIKALIGNATSNITLGYNPIFDFEDGFFFETMTPFLLNRNAGIHVNVLHFFNNSHIAIFMNNTFILNQGFKTYNIAPGLILNFKKVQIAPYLRNSVTKIEGFNDSRTTELGLSFYFKV